MGSWTKKLSRIGLSKETLPVVSAGAAALLGFTAVLGWHAHQPSLIQVAHGFAAFPYAEALAFFCSGMAFLAVLSDRGSISMFFASLSTIVTFASVFQEVMPPSLLDLELHARMSAPSIAAFLSANLALMCGRRGGLFSAAWQGFAGSVIAAIGSAAFFGYVSGLQGAYRWWGVAPIAVQSSIGLMFFGAGLTAFSYARRSGEQLIPYRVLPFEAALSLVVMSFISSFALKAHDLERFRGILNAKALAVRNELSTRIEGHLGSLVQRVRTWEIDGMPSPAKWNKDIDFQLQHYTFRTISWVEPNLTTRWSRNRQGATAGPRLKARLSVSDRGRLERGRSTREPVLLAVSGPGVSNDFTYYVPIFTGRQFQGFLAAEFHLPDMLDFLLQDDFTAGYSLHLSQGRSLLFSRAFQGEVEVARQSLNFSVAGKNWMMSLAPSPFTVEKESSLLPSAVLVVGLIFAFLVGSLIFSAQLAHRRVLEIQVMNDELRREITERQKVEKQLVETGRAALQAAKAKAEFLANMSHEIRTPLNAVVGMTDLLADTRLGREQHEMLRTVRYSADALLALINDILDFSKIDAGKLEIERVDFDLKELVKATEGMLGPEAKKRRLRLSVRVAWGTPQHWHGDPVRLRQVLINLLNNAIKFTKKGNVALFVTPLGNEVNRTGLRFEVHDTGIGIPDEARPRIFQVFSQVDSSTTRKYGGTGLGLSICKHLVELMGGKIGFESSNGKGSIFWFEIPWTPAEGKQPTRVLASKGKARVRKSAQILVAEDNAINQKVIAKMLEKMGHKPYLVADGKGALHALERKNFDLVLMDCQMPEMDGYEATRKIRAGTEHSEIPILALTAHAMEEDKAKCFAAGMNDFVTKPIDRRSLESVVNHWLAPGAEARNPMSQTSANKASVIDEKVIDEVLALSGDADSASFFEELLAMFDQAAREAFGQLHQAALQHEGEELTRVAHKLKSAAGNLGAVRMAETCRSIEMAAKQGDVSGAGAKVHELEQQYAAAQRALGERLQVLKINSRKAA